MIKALVLSVTLLVSTCQTGPFPKPTPQPEPIDPWPDGAAPARDGGTPAGCAAACDWWTVHDCPEAKPTAKGATCVEVCQNTEDSGVISLGLDCVVHADSQADPCAAARACSYAVKRKP
jgi:hypothetical protein